MADTNNPDGYFVHGITLLVAIAIAAAVLVGVNAWAISSDADEQWWAMPLIISLTGVVISVGASLVLGLSRLSPIIRQIGFYLMWSGMTVFVVGFGWYVWKEFTR